MDAQDIFNVIFSGLMVLVLVVGAIFLFAKACYGEWEFIAGAIIGAIMTAAFYGNCVLSNLPNK